MTIKRITDPAKISILAFSDKLFTPSESFVHRSYRAFDKIDPLFIGHETKSPVPDGIKALSLCDLYAVPDMQEQLFKQFGQLSNSILQRLQDEEPRLIHAHFGKSAAYALPLAQKLNLPLVVTYYGGDATKTANTEENIFRVYNRRRQKIWDYASLILPCSDFIRRELDAKGAPAGKMKVHHNTADPEKFAGRPDKKKIIMFAGRWVEKKGIETLVKALSLIPESLKDWEVKLYGDGPLKQELEKQLHQTNVGAQMPGWINAEEMPKKMAEAMILVAPSQRAKSGDAEGLPLVCVEAMLCECAIAGTYHAGIPEVVDHGRTGYLINEKDHIGLADHLKQMVKDPDKTLQMGRLGRERALGKFNLIQQSKQLESYFLDIIG